MSAITPIPNKTALGLVEYCKAQVGLPYWNGTYGQTATKELYERLKKKHPEHYKAKDYESQFGLRVHDCCGLVKGYMWSKTPTSPPKYNPDQDCNAWSFYDRSIVRGTIKTFPATSGIILYNSTKGHMGVYSDNYVYEAKGHAYGVVKSQFSASKWAYWSECPYISYGYEDIVRFSDFPVLNLGSQGVPVKVVQTMLGGTIDGDFGPKTEGRVKEYQRLNGLTVDGVVGRYTWESLIIKYIIVTV